MDPVSRIQESQINSFNKWEKVELPESIVNAEAIWWMLDIWAVEFWFRTKSRAFFQSWVKYEVPNWVCKSSSWVEIEASWGVP